MNIPEKKLIFHFDVNKTLIISDPAAGLSAKQMLRLIVYESIWGYEENNKFILYPCKPSKIKPKNTSDKTLITFKKYFYKNNSNSIPNEITKLYKSLKKLLELKDHNNNIITEEERKKLPKWLEKSKYYFLLPAFWELIIYLSNNNLLHRCYFRFRSFGSDFNEIRDEFNIFCDGNHPYYSNIKLNGNNNNHLDFTFNDSKQFGVTFQSDLYRAVVLGSCDLIPEIDIQKNNIKSINDIVEYLTNNYKQRNISIDKIITDPLELYDYFTYNKNNYPFRSLFVREHYEYWNITGRTKDTGKYHPINENDDSIEYNIFFDDYVTTRNTIINVHDINTNTTITDSISFNKSYICGVDTIQLLMDKNYYINIISSLLDI